MEELKCDVCGKTGFKSKAGLAGHKKIVHGVTTKKVVPDEIGKRLEHLEKFNDAIPTRIGELFEKFIGDLQNNVTLLSFIVFQAIEGQYDPEKLKKQIQRLEHEDIYKPILDALELKKWDKKHESDKNS